MIILPEKSCYIHIANREQNRRLRGILHENGFVWSSGASLTEDKSNFDDTHFHVFIDTKRVKLCSNLSNMENKDHVIIDYKDIDDDFIRFYLNERGKLNV